MSALIDLAGPIVDGANTFQASVVGNLDNGINTAATAVGNIESSLDSYVGAPLTAAFTNTTSVQTGVTSSTQSTFSTSAPLNTNTMFNTSSTSLTNSIGSTSTNEGNPIHQYGLGAAAVAIVGAYLL